MLNKLRQKHALQSGEGAVFGVDLRNGGITDTYANFVWEPAVVKVRLILPPPSHALVLLC